jgi:DNA-binding Lrp family transcriptional regulator
MKVMLTESQYTRLIESDWDREKLYDREKVVEKLRKGPKYIKDYIKKLPNIPVENEKGEVKIATRIPQTIHEYLFGNF